MIDSALTIFFLFFLFIFSFHFLNSIFFDTPGSVKTLEVFQSDGISSELPLEPRFTNFPEPHSLFFLLRKKKRAHDQGWQRLYQQEVFTKKETKKYFIPFPFNKKHPLLDCRLAPKQLGHCDWRHGV